MDYNVKSDVPSFYLDTEDTDKYLDVIQHGVGLIHDDLSGFIKQTDYELADDKFIDLMLVECGWMSNFTVSKSVKRKIVNFAQYIYSTKGTELGIINAIKQILDIDVTIANLGEEGFELANNSLGEDTELGYEGYALHFVIMSPVITAEELDIMTKIVNYMRWAVNTYSIVQV